MTLFLTRQQAPVLAIYWGVEGLVTSNTTKANGHGCGRPVEEVRHNLRLNLTRSVGTAMAAMHPTCVPANADGDRRYLSVSGTCCASLSGTFCNVFSLTSRRSLSLICEIRWKPHLFFQSFMRRLPRRMINPRRRLKLPMAISWSIWILTVKKYLLCCAFRWVKWASSLVSYTDKRGAGHRTDGQISRPSSQLPQEVAPLQFR